MSNRTVLVIDDEPDFIEAVKMRLEPNGYKILEAHDGAEGVEIARRETPGLILLDLVMPKSNGLETLSQLKSHGKTDLIPVIMITAKSEKEYVLDSGLLGAADYMVKPIDMQALVEIVNKYLPKEPG